MKYRRGFKAEANAYSRDLRSELDLKFDDPLCPWQLAEHLAIPVVPVSTLKSDIPEGVAYLLEKGRDHFSAVTACFGLNGTHRVILHNDANPPTRQAADISHELSHAILGHVPTEPFDEDGNRRFDPAAEAEANWMGPALLISEEAALHVVRQGLDVQPAARRYGVSPKLMNMRINVTGARRRVRNNGHK